MRPKWTVFCALLGVAWLPSLPLPSAAAHPPDAPAKPVPATTVAAEAAALRKATVAFLATQDAAQRVQAVLPFDSEERLNWHFVPRARKGVRLLEMKPPQEKAALALLSAGLSASGYRKVSTIRQLETVLRAMEGDTQGGYRNPGFYYLTVFGTPEKGDPWGVRYEGHHVSLNWTVIGARIIGDSPQFLGANPATVRDGPLRGTRALAPEEDLARTLVTSLSDAQRKEGVLPGPAPRDIVTGAQRQAAIQEDKGIAYSRLTSAQRGMLLALIRTYADVQPPAIAEQRLSKIRRAGLETIKFAWMGGLRPGEGHYYRVQGPTFLIEYDNTQNNANHVHTVWRDFQGDFGADLLREHYQAQPHGTAPARGSGPI